MNLQKKRLAISLGDANGISAEIIAKFLGIKTALNFLPIIYGNQDIFLQWNKILKKTSNQNTVYWDLFWEKVSANEILFQEESKKIIVKPASACAESGELSFLFLKKAILDVLEKKADALVTAPINKLALKKANLNYKGHTPILLELTNTKNYSMIFHSEVFSLSLVSDHIPLRDVPNFLTSKKILQCILLCFSFAKKIGIASPSIAVCGLNPHAGEEKILGEEEETIILPAITQAKKKESMF